MDDFELAKALFKQPKDTKSARVVSGTAYADSADGSVQVSIDGSVVTLPTNVSVKDGDTVQVTLSDRSPVVTGVVGRGDEVETEIGDARKVATNYIDYSVADGVVVGNMTEGVLGANTQICVEDVLGVDKATINLRDGSTVLAKFQDDRLELGTNAPSSTIGLCGGKAQMYLTPDSGFYIVGADDTTSLVTKMSRGDNEAAHISYIDSNGRTYAYIRARNANLGTSSIVEAFDETSVGGPCGIEIDGAVSLGSKTNPGTVGQVLTSQGAGQTPVWTTPAGGGVTFDLIYDTPLYYWGSGSISGTDSGSDDPSRAGRPYGELDAPITDYDVLIVCFRCGASAGAANLTNARLTQVIPVSEIEFLTTSQIDNATKTYEFIYCVPAGTPTWYTDVAYGFTNSTTLYAKRRSYYQNLPYWNIDKIYGVKF